MKRSTEIAVGIGLAAVAAFYFTGRRGTSSPSTGSSSAQTNTSSMSLGLSVPMPVPSWVYSNSTVSGEHSTAGQSVASATVTAMQNGAPKSYLIVVIGAKSATDIVNYLTSIGWQQPQATNVKTATIQTSGQVPLNQLV